MHDPRCPSGRAALAASLLSPCSSPAAAGRRRPPSAADSPAPSAVGRRPSPSATVRVAPRRASAPDARPDPGPVRRADRRPGAHRRLRHRAGLGPRRHVHDGHRRGGDRRARGSQARPPGSPSEFPSEQPAHKVTLTKGYWIDKTEVTNAAFAAFVDAGGYTNQALWSDDGWAWLGDRTPRACRSTARATSRSSRGCA